MTSTIKRGRRTKTEMDALREALYQSLSEYHPMTVRQVFYQMVSRGVIEKTETNYKNVVCRLLADMRVSKELPYDWISDNTRWMRKPRTYSSMRQMLRYSAQTYRRAVWDDQAVYVEVWCEKDALAGVLMEETKPFDVPLMVSRGFSSISYLYGAAEQIKDECKPAYLYYFGDYDPSGLLIPRTIERKLRELAPDAEIHFERVAVTPEQIWHFELPTRPTKTGGTHAKSFIGESVELDAIPAPELRSMVRRCITQHIDQGVYERTLQAEQMELETLRRIEQGWERLIA